MSKLKWEDVINGGKSIAPADVRVMLDSYGFVIDTASRSSRDKWVHPVHHLTVIFSGAVKDIDEGALKDCAKACKEADRLNQLAKQKLPEKLPDWVKLPPGYEACIKDAQLIVWDKEFPEVQLCLDPQNKAGFAKELRGYHQRVDVHSQILGNLAAQYGFTFSRSNGEFIAAQNDYGIEQRFTIGEAADYTEPLTQLERKAEEIYFDRGAMLESLIDQGFVLQKQDHAVTISHPKLAQPVTIPLLGDLERLDSNGMNAISKAVSDISAVKTSAPAARPVAPPAAPASREKPVVRHTIPAYRLHPQKPMPADQQVTLIWDASALNKLAVPRRNGRSWLDLLPVTSELSSVKQMIIPAIIADYELRGGVATERAGQMEFVQVDPDFLREDNRKGRHNAALRELLESASRWRLDANGKGRMIVGKNPNLVIYETPFDRKFLDQVLAIQSKPGYSIADRVKKITHLKNESGNHLGERAMVEAARVLQNGGPAYLVTNDIDFLLSRPEICTKDGFPVGESVLLGYLRGEMESRSEEIKQRMHEEFGFSESNFSLATIKKDIATGDPFLNVLNGDYPELYNTSKPGTYQTAQGLVTGESLETIFARGVAHERGDKKYSFIMPLPLGYTAGPVVAAATSAPPSVASPVAPVAAKSPAPAAPASPAVTASSTPVASPAAVPPPQPPSPPAVAAPPAIKPAVPPPSQPVFSPKKIPLPAAAVVAAAGAGAVASSDAPPVPLVTPKNQPPYANGTPPAKTPQPPAAPIPAKTHTGENGRNKLEPIKDDAEESFGYHVGIHRMNRNMSEGQLAEAVLQIAQYRPEVDHVMVHRWESNQALPDGELYWALVQVLIEDNTQVGNKEEAKARLQEAYQRTRKSIESNPAGPDRFAFTNMLYDLRHNAKLSEQDLADKMAQAMQVQMEETPQLINNKLIFKIERGMAVPSLGFVRAMVKALDQKKPLEENEKRELYAAYEKIKEKAQQPALVAR